MKLLERTLSNALRVFNPPPELTVSQWADENRILSPEAAAEPGKWRTDRAPYQREIMDSVKDPDITEIVVMSSAQVGKTELILNVTGYFIDHDPAPMLIVQPTGEMAQSFSKDRLASMIRDTPCLRKKVTAAGSKKSGNTLLHKKFPGGHITLTGSNSAAGLASRPIRIVLFDETDRYPMSAGTEGDPITLGKKRTNTFFNRLSILVSTPTVKGASRIEKAFEHSDQRRYEMPCPGCSDPVHFDFKALVWDKKDTSVVTLPCPHCGLAIENSDKYEMLAQGKWVSQAPDNKGIAGFHLNELYSPWKTWVEVVDDFLKAKKDPEQLKAFINTSLGETWEVKGDAPDHEKLFNRRSMYKRNEIPDPVCFLTAAVDVQKDRLEVEIKGWGKERRNWSIDYRVLIGDTSQPGVYQELDKILNETWESEDGSKFQILKMAIDSGFNTTEVYNFARRHGSRVMAIKGRESLQAIVGSPSPQEITTRSGKKLKRGVWLWPVGVNVVKRETFSYLKTEVPSDGGDYPVGFSFFPADYDLNYFESLCSEVEDYKIKDGYRHYFFRKIRERNEALDLMVYNRAAAAALGIDRYKNSDFDKIRSRSGSVNQKQKIKWKKSSFLQDL